MLFWFLSYLGVATVLSSMVLLTPLVVRVFAWFTSEETNSSTYGTSLTTAGVKNTPVDSCQPPTGGTAATSPIKRSRWVDEYGYIIQPKVEITLDDFISWINEVPPEAIVYRSDTLNCVKDIRYDKPPKA